MQSASFTPQAWEDVASDVCASIESALKPLLKRAADDIYAGLLDTTQDYLANNMAFNIASRISSAEREAARDRERYSELLAALREIAALGDRSPLDGNVTYEDAEEAIGIARAAILKATGDSQ